MVCNRIALRIDPGGVNTTPARTPTYYSGFQLEDVTASGRVVPSEFQEPSDTSALIFDREITDGKIVTQFYASKPQSIGYGPQANVTPTGLPNPEPHGDFLVDTSNNNIMFRYHQNIPSARVWSPDSTFAQTLIYTSPAPGDADGWYALEDPRTSNALATAETTAANTTAQEALQRAASAASAADAEILVFFESSTNASMYLDTYNYGSFDLVLRRAMVIFGFKLIKYTIPMELKTQDQFSLQIFLRVRVGHNPQTMQLVVHSSNHSQQQASRTGCLLDIRHGTKNNKTSSGPLLYII